MQELWKPIKNFENVYEVSNSGQVRRLDTLIPFSGKLAIREGRLMKLTKNSKGYLTIVLCWKGLRKTYSVHLLVADAFILKIPTLTQVNHIDGNALNNTEENLERCTSTYNQLHAYRLGLKPQAEETAKSILSNKQVLEIKLILIQPRLESNNRLYKRIARLYKVSRTSIKWIDKGRTWKSVQLHNGQELTTFDEQNGKNLP